jgi:hypothetical protein
MFSYHILKDFFLEYTEELCIIILSKRKGGQVHQYKKDTTHTQQPTHTHPPTPTHHTGQRPKARTRSHTTTDQTPPNFRATTTTSYYTTRQPQPKNDQTHYMNLPNGGLNPLPTIVMLLVVLSSS